MVSEISLLGITFHWYGLILGLSVVVWVNVVSWLLSTYLKKQKKSLDESKFFTVLSAVLIGAVVGARIWHVVTDWHLYSGNLSAVFFVWNGGLSIFGALAGGLVVLASRPIQKLLQVPQVVFLDAMVIGLPFAQAIGRWANFVNQELYGKPTDLPWAVPIDPIHRLPGYEAFSLFHPLFLYESIALLLLGSAFWMLHKKYELGRGIFVICYVYFYASWRFGLDFLRIGVSELWGGLSFNQLCMLCVILLVSISLYDKKNRTSSNKK